LRMIAGAAGKEGFAQALRAYMRTVIDKGLSALNFAARVIISTRASLASAVLGAYWAFTRALPRGAPGFWRHLPPANANNRQALCAHDGTQPRRGRAPAGLGPSFFRGACPAPPHAARGFPAPRPRQPPPRLRPAGRARRGREARAAQARPPARSQYRDGRRSLARRHRLAARRLHTGLCHDAGARLDRAPAGAALLLPDDSRCLRLCLAGPGLDF